MDTRSSLLSLWRVQQLGVWSLCLSPVDTRATTILSALCDFFNLTSFFNIILNVTLPVFFKLTLLAAPIALTRPNTCAAPCMLARQRTDMARAGLGTDDVARPAAPPTLARQCRALIRGAAGPNIPSEQVHHLAAAPVARPGYLAG